MFRTISVAMLGVVLTACAGTPPSEQVAAAAPAAKTVSGSAVKAGDDRKVCKQLKPPGGSRLSKPPVCRTQAEWTAEANAGREFAEDIQATGALNPARDD